MQGGGSNFRLLTCYLINKAIQGTHSHQGGRVHREGHSPPREDTWIVGTGIHVSARKYVS